MVSVRRPRRVARSNDQDGNNVSGGGYLGDVVQTYTSRQAWSTPLLAARP